MGRPVLAFFIVAVILLSSCDESRVLDEYESLPGKWHKDSVVDFTFSAPDTLQPYDLFINLRNSADYPYSNLYLITEIAFPNGKVVADTLQYEMAAPSGEWLGTGFGEIKESKLWYKEDFVFSEAGEYSVRIEQAMRKRDSINGIVQLDGITDVGLRIENSDNK